MTKEEIREADRLKKLEKLNTLTGRADNLIRCYKREDLKNNRGECDLTVEWLIDNILMKPCAHCGKTGWKSIGCNRLDNSKPHTKDNVEPCCLKCNLKMWGKDSAKKVYQYTLDGELVKIWCSSTDAARELGYKRGSIKDCCHGGRYMIYGGERKWYKCTQHKGYKWSYEPL